MEQKAEKRWYQLSPKEVAEKLDTNLETGLTESTAEDRRKKYGDNLLIGDKSETWIDRIVGELKSPLTFILLGAGIVTTLLAEYLDATVIFIALIINIAISLYQEGRASSAFDKLKESQQKFAVVIRGGEKKRIDAGRVVPGDLIVIETGMSVVADIRVIKSSNIEVNESALTGEWLEVSKNTETLEAILPPTDTKNMLFMGTYITGGNGLGIAVETGERTQLGIIARALKKTEDPRTPLQENITEIARWLSYVILGALVIIFGLGLMRGEPLTELFLVAIAIAVAAIPEGLPAAVTVILAIGMEQILKRGGLVRNLLAAETLGSTTVIMTDKTGTLTQAEMRVARVITYGTLENEEEGGNLSKEHEAHGDERDALTFAAFASDAFIERVGSAEKSLAEPIVRGRPVERAVVLAALQSGVDQSEILHNYPRLDFLAFESRFRAAYSLHKVRGLKSHRVYITGAPEFLLENANEIYLEGKAHPKTPQLTKRFEEALQVQTAQGMRIIAIAYNEVDIDHFTHSDDTERGMLTKDIVFVGYIVLQDPLRSDVKESIATAQMAGARVIMATGDNPETARAIALECGILHGEGTIATGKDVEEATDEVLAKMLEDTQVFARMLPEHKMRLVKMLSDKGEVVAMTGDGVNDAPALRAADIGVALGSGTEVAKEASDIVLLNNSFSIIVAAIEEGRRIIDNLRKVVIYLLSTSFTEIIVVGGALISGMALPLLPTQILWTNMLSEGFMNFAYAFEPKEEDVMRRDPRDAQNRRILSKRTALFIGAIGLCFGLILLVLYWFLINIEELSVGASRTVIFAALTLGTTFISFSLKDLRSPIWTIAPWSNRYLLISLAFSIFGLVSAFYFAPIQKLLRIEPVPFSVIGTEVVAVILLNLAAVEAAKFFFFKRREKLVIR